MWAILIIIVLVAIWIYYFQFRDPGYENIKLDVLYPRLKTGDLILFKALDNWNAPKIGCYFTHIAVVWMRNGIPWLVEAAATREMALEPDNNHYGMFATPLETRVKQYRGWSYYKPYTGPVISQERLTKFEHFITWAMQNMFYEYNVLGNGLRKGMGAEKCGTGTNCGEFTFLCLIVLGIMKRAAYDSPTFHHLRMMCYISNDSVLTSGYKFDEPKKILFDSLR